jgi:hypothetical protein
MKNAIVLALLLMRMVAEEIVMEAACQEEGRIIRKYLAIGTWLDHVQVRKGPNTKYQEPIS